MSVPPSPSHRREREISSLSAEEKVSRRLRRFAFASFSPVLCALILILFVAFLQVIVLVVVGVVVALGRRECAGTPLRQ